jgi:iron complex outermembrane receptor protein
MATHRILGCASGLISALPIVFFAASSARAADPSTGSETKSTGLEEIVVTAMKRDENLQSVAASISAVSGATIQQQRLQTYEDLQNAVAGLVAIPGPADFGAVNMRGTYTAINDSPGVDEPTSVYIDDVATFGHVDRAQKLFDIDRVEVLRGPQGTAFGKNSIGGVVSIHTAAPSFTPDVQMSATGGNFGLAEFQGLVTGPLNDQVAAKLSGYYHHQDGYVDDPTLGRKIGAQRTFGVRGQVLADVTDTFKVLAGVDYLQDDSDSPPQTFIGNGAFVAANGPFFPLVNFPTFLAPTGPDTTLQSANFKGSRRSFNAFVRADWDLNFAELTSITGYRQNKTNTEKSEVADPINFFNGIFAADDWGATEELRLVSPGDSKFTWLVGTYLSTMDIKRATILTPDSLFLSTLGFGSQYSMAKSVANSESVFGEIGYKFTDPLRLVLGGRYTHDQKTGTVAFEGQLQGGFENTAVVAPQRGSWSDFTPKATLEFTPTKDTLFYATVARGYVGGGFEAAGPGLATAAADIAALQHPYNPEYATNYEIGAKTSWFDNRLTANIDIYREDFKDLQVMVAGFVISGGVPVGTSLAGNAGRTRSQGLDLEIRAVPAPWLRLGATYSYSDDKYLTTDPNLAIAGNHLPFTPQNSLNLSAEGTWGFDWGTVSTEGDVTYRSKSWSTFMNGNLSDPNNPGDPPAVHDRTGINGLLNASVDYKRPDGRWDLRLWARNLTDTRFGAPIESYILFAPLLGYTGSYYSLMQWNPPRTFGVTASYHLR